MVELILLLVGADELFSDPCFFFSSAFQMLSAEKWKEGKKRAFVIPSNVFSSWQSLLPIFFCLSVPSPKGTHISSLFSKHTGGYSLSSIVLGLGVECWTELKSWFDKLLHKDCSNSESPLSYTCHLLFLILLSETKHCTTFNRGKCTG